MSIAVLSKFLKNRLIRIGFVGWRRGSTGQYSTAALFSMMNYIGPGCLPKTCHSHVDLSKNHGAGCFDFYRASWLLTVRCKPRNPTAEGLGGSACSRKDKWTGRRCPQIREKDRRHRQWCCREDPQVFAQTGRLVVVRPGMLRCGRAQLHCCGKRRFTVT